MNSILWFGAGAAIGYLYAKGVIGKVIAYFKKK